MKAGWIEKSLGECVTLHYGKPLARSERSEVGKYPVFGANGIKAQSEKYLVEGPSIIVGRKGSAGEINIIYEKFWPLDVTYFSEHDSNLIDFGFLHYMLRKQNLPSMARGVKPGINRNDVYALKVLLPPLEEQKRIVAILDAAFEGLDRARAHTEANLQNARDLFESHLENVFAGLRKVSENRKVKDVANHCLGKMLDKRKNKGEYKPYLRNLNVRWFDVATEDVKTMRFEDKEAERYEVKNGDLLICEGGYPGRAAIWDSSETIFFQKALHRVRFPKKVHNKLLMFYLYLMDANGGLEDSFTGTGIQHFTGKALGELELPFPNESQAITAVAQIEKIQSQTNIVGTRYEQKLADLEDLRQSLLQKAFAGELT